VTAHAVRHNGESTLARELFVGGGLPVSVLVLVIFSLAANIAHAGQLNSRAYSHHTSHVFLD
jgi:hypothetical protein